MTVTVAIVLLAVATYALRASGLLLGDNNAFVDRYAGALTAGILASLVVSSSVTAGKDLTVDARLVGLIVATICALARLPLVVTLVLAVSATAIARILT